MVVVGVGDDGNWARPPSVVEGVRIAIHSLYESSSLSSKGGEMSGGVVVDRKGLLCEELLLLLTRSCGLRSVGGGLSVVVAGVFAKSNAPPTPARSRTTSGGDVMEDDDEPTSSSTIRKSSGIRSATRARIVSSPTIFIARVHIDLDMLLGRKPLWGRGR